jgi:hypothetical protein
MNLQKDINTGLLFKSSSSSSKRPLKSPTQTPKSPTPSHRSPTPSLKSPTQTPKSPTPSRKSPTPSQRSPTPSQRSPTPSQRSPTPSQRSPIQSPKSPTQSRRSPTYKSSSRIFSNDILFENKVKIIQKFLRDKLSINKVKKIQDFLVDKPTISDVKKMQGFLQENLSINKIKKIQSFLRGKLSINKNTLKNRIHHYNLIKNRLSLLKDGDCLEEKTFNGENGYTIRNIINLEKKMGRPSKFGTIYLTNIPNLLGTYFIATKVMEYNTGNSREVFIMNKITNEIILKKLSRHFIMIYCSSNCTEGIPDNTKLRYISVNELADGDLKMLCETRDILEDNDLMLNLLFQTYISIATLQNSVEYVHNDTHAGNFLFHYNNENIKGYYHYVFNEKDYYLKCCKYNIIIFDFGKAKNIYFEHNCINIHYDYKRILYAFMKKGKGLGIYDDLPKNETNIIVDNILSEMNNLYGKPYKSPLGKNLFSDIIENILLKYTPKDMFITERPSIILNSVPFTIDIEIDWID